MENNTFMTQRKKREVERKLDGELRFKDEWNEKNIFRDNEKNVPKDWLKWDFNPEKMYEYYGKMRDHQSYGTEVVLFPKTENNLFINKYGNWLRCKDGSRFDYKKNQQAFLSNLETKITFERYNTSLKGFKKRIFKRIDKLELPKKIRNVYISEIKAANSLGEVNAIIRRYEKKFVKNGMKKFIGGIKEFKIPLNKLSNEEKTLNKGDKNIQTKRDEEFDIVNYLSDHELTTIFTFYPEQERLIENGFYKPFYEREKHGKYKGIEMNGFSIDKWGCKDIDYNKFVDLGNLYIKKLKYFKEKQHGKLPDKKSHILSATWQFDTQMPTLIIEVSNASYRLNQKLNKNIFQIKSNHEFRNHETDSDNSMRGEFVKLFENVITESVK